MTAYDIGRGNASIAANSDLYLYVAGYPGLLR
jgi:hypothetical protein